MAPIAAAETEDLRVYFFPFVSPGHMIPMLDMAVLFARRPGVAVTVITTTANEPLVRTTVDRSAKAGHPPIQLLLLSFPVEAQPLLPGGKENMAAVSYQDFGPLYAATFTLDKPLLSLLRRHPLPHCLISDSIYAWSADVADELAVPRVVFYGPGAFALCVHESLERRRAPQLAGDSEPFLVDGLPHPIELTPAQLPETIQYPTPFDDQKREANARSYGVVVNSFVEFEPEYADLFRSEPRRKAWFVGPVSLCHADDSDRAARGASADDAADGVDWRGWLDGRPAGSVVYVCFGSLGEFSAEQLREIAAGLEDSGHPFIWVVRGGAAASGEWSPPPASERGLVINGWAPQVVILNHPAVGGFVTHCGWNSTLETAAAGVPVVTWPLFYDQFVNEKLIVDLLRVGVTARGAVSGGGNVIMMKGEAVGASELAAAVGRVMGGGEEAERRRQRARDLAEAARAAMEEGGSSHRDLENMIDDLRTHAAAVARAAVKLNGKLES